MGDIKGDTGSLDYSSYGFRRLGFRGLGDLILAWLEELTPWASSLDPSRGRKQNTSTLIHRDIPLESPNHPNTNPPPPRYGYHPKKVILGFCFLC